MKILLWNIEWASPASLRGKRIRKIITDKDPDVICFTEATRGIIPPDGHAVESEPHYGYPNKGNRRNVILWSKQPWSAVDSLGSKDLPGGRFVSGITGDTRIVGVCIPWFAAHVTTGRKDRVNWQDHLLYLKGLRALLANYRIAEVPFCVTGDFNQRIPRSRQPESVFQQLTHTFAGLKFVTADKKDEDDHLLIDHVAVSQVLLGQVEGIIPQKLAPGMPLSDHAGIIASIAISDSS